MLNILKKISICLLLIFSLIWIKSTFADDSFSALQIWTGSFSTGDIGNSYGATVWDFDWDGKLEIYVANEGQNKIYSIKTIEFTPTASSKAGIRYTLNLDNQNYGYTTLGVESVQTIVEWLQAKLNSIDNITCEKDNTKITCFWKIWYEFDFSVSVRDTSLFTLDINWDWKYTALTDGVLILRFLSENSTINTTWTSGAENGRNILEYLKRLIP